MRAHPPCGLEHDECLEQLAVFEAAPSRKAEDTKSAVDIRGKYTRRGACSETVVSLHASGTAPFAAATSTSSGRAAGHESPHSAGTAGLGEGVRVTPASTAATSTVPVLSGVSPAYRGAEVVATSAATSAACTSGQGTRRRKTRRKGEAET